MDELYTLANRKCWSWHRVPKVGKFNALQLVSGVGNSLWAFGVLCFWHRPCVKARKHVTHHRKVASVVAFAVSA